MKCAAVAFLEGRTYISWSDFGGSVFHKNVGIIPVLARLSSGQGVFLQQLKRINGQGGRTQRHDEQHKPNLIIERL